MHIPIRQGLVDEARALAHDVCEPVMRYIRLHSTFSIERAALVSRDGDGLEKHFRQHHR